MKPEKVIGTLGEGERGAVLKGRANWAPTWERNVSREESNAFSLRAEMPKAMALGWQVR